MNKRIDRFHLQLFRRGGARREHTYNSTDQGGFSETETDFTVDRDNIKDDVDREYILRMWIKVEKDVER